MNNNIFQINEGSYQLRLYNNIYSNIHNNVYNNVHDTIFDGICDDEAYYLNIDKITNKYYIGIYFQDNDNIYILSSSVSNDTFFKYNTYELINYLDNISCVANNVLNLEIMKLNIQNDGTYTVILKTYWIKLIQRHIKKLFKIRNSMIINNLYNYNIKYNYTLRIPLKGMLNIYKKNDR
jgi:hypothetical protein